MSVPNVEDFVVCWLQPLIRAAVERGSDEVLPFALVARISGADDPDCGTDDPVVQVDVLGVDAAAAASAAEDMHDRMNYLARNLENVVLSDDSVANADYVKTLIKPFRMPYVSHSGGRAVEHDRIVRYVARYRLGLSFVAV